MSTAITQTETTTTTLLYDVAGTSSSVVEITKLVGGGGTCCEIPNTTSTTLCDVLNPHRAASSVSSHSDSPLLDAPTSDHDVCPSESAAPSAPVPRPHPTAPRGKYSKYRYNVTNLQETHKRTSTIHSLGRSTSLPFELYRPIFAFVTDPRDLRNLAVASPITQPDAERFLHSTICAYGIRDVTNRCRHLARFPRVAAFTRKIVFRDIADKSFSSCQPLPSFFSLVESALISISLCSISVIIWRRKNRGRGTIFTFDCNPTQTRQLG